MKRRRVSGASSASDLSGRPALADDQSTLKSDWDRVEAFLVQATLEMAEARGGSGLKEELTGLDSSLEMIRA
jgi:hypothetical protein